MQIRSLLVGGTIVITGLVAAACSGGSDGGAPADAEGAPDEGAPTCASTGRRICARACACGATKCKTGIPNRFGTFTTLTWSDLGDCEAAYASSRCKNGGPVGVDYAACMTAVEAAQCAEDVFVEPAECEAARDAGD